jgi:hypothetical protein
MDEDDGPAPVQLVHERGEGRVAEVASRHAAEQDDAVGVQFVQGVGGLGEGSVHVGKRERGEEPEALRSVLDRLGGELVDPPSPVAGGRCGSWVVPGEVDARRGHRQDARLDAQAVHHRDGAAAVPVRDGYAAGLDALPHEPLAVLRGNNVLVRVDSGGHG